MIYRRLKGYKYELMEPEEFQTAININIRTKYIKIIDGLMTVAAHYASDGPSGPTFDTATFMRGALIHDAFYQLIREGYLTKHHRKYADQLLRRICLEDGMNRFRAWYIYKAVRIGGIFTSKPKKNPRGQVIKLVKNAKGKLVKKAA